MRALLFRPALPLRRDGCAGGMTTGWWHDDGVGGSLQMHAAMCAGRRSGAGAFTQSVSSVSLPVDVLHVSDTNRRVGIFAMQVSRHHHGHVWINSMGSKSRFCWLFSNISDSYSRDMLQCHGAH
jgi:hypothetical protein